MWDARRRQDPMRQKVGLKLQCALQYDSSGVKAVGAMALNGSDIDMMAEGNWPMRIQQLTLLSAAALALSTVPSIAGPCSQRIDQMQAQINASWGTRSDGCIQQEPARRAWDTGHQRKASSA
jgi:hypothetical protein